MKYTLVDQICLGIIVLFGQPGEAWEYMETDPEWWAVHLWTKRN